MIRQPSLLIAILAAAGSGAAQEPATGLLLQSPYPQVERLVHQAERINGPLTGQALAALPATPELLALLVADPGVGKHLGSVLYAMYRPPRTSAYGLWLASQVDQRELANELMYEVYKYHRGTVAAQVALRFAPCGMDRGFDALCARLAAQEPELQRQALALLEHRIPLDWPILSRILPGQGKDKPLEGKTAARLRQLLPRITAEALEELDSRFAGLARPLQALLRAGLAAIPKSDPRYPLVSALGNPRRPRAAAPAIPATAQIPKPAGALRAKDRAVASTGSETPIVLWVLTGTGLALVAGWTLSRLSRGGPP